MPRNKKKIHSKLQSVGRGEVVAATPLGVNLGQEVNNPYKRYLISVLPFHVGMYPFFTIIIVNKGLNNHRLSLSSRTYMGSMEKAFTYRVTA